MEQLSLLTRISLLGTLIFAVLWFITPKGKVYETIEMDIVSVKKVFLVLTMVCFGSFLASLFAW